MLMKINIGIIILIRKNDIFDIVKSKIKIYLITFQIKYLYSYITNQYIT